jgi:hypothetical protein
MLAWPWTFARLYGHREPHLEYSDDDYATEVIVNLLRSCLLRGIDVVVQVARPMSAPAINAGGRDLHLHPSWQRVLQDLMRTFH